MKEIGTNNESLKIENISNDNTIVINILFIIIIVVQGILFFLNKKTIKVISLAIIFITILIYICKTVIS
jgi:hypothetical protein